MTTGLESVSEYHVEVSDGSVAVTVTALPIKHAFLGSGKFAMKVTTKDQENNTVSTSTVMKVSLNHTNHSSMNSCPVNKFKIQFPLLTIISCSLGLTMWQLGLFVRSQFPVHGSYTMCFLF